jgi:hypothetical protein
VSHSNWSTLERFVFLHHSRMFDGFARDPVFRLQSITWQASKYHLADEVACRIKAEANCVHWERVGDVLNSTSDPFEK